MIKKAKEVSENFLTSNVFTFDSVSCTCKTERVSSYPGIEPAEVVRISGIKNSPIRFAYGSKIGLIRINEDGSAAESNILGKLLAIKNDKIENYFSFFEKNGFLVPVSVNTTDSIEEINLQLIIDRLQATLELMSTITDMSKTSYEKIVRMIFYHLFSPVVQIETRDGRYQYISSKHQYTIFLDKALDLQKDERFNDTFNNASFDFNDTISSFALDADFIDKVLKGTLLDGKFDNDLFRKVFAVYCTSRNGIPKNILKINDFIFHYLYEVGMVAQVDLNRIEYINGEVNKSSFSDSMKCAAVDIAKIIIKEEIESNLRRVRPTYNTNKLEPAWKIDSLLSALYFGLFYMRPTMETYRRCANPKCGEFFLVNISSQKKKYCCTACMNREMSARKRARDKIRESSEK